MASTSVLLVLGAGKNIGTALASQFSAAGYKVALAARSIDDGPTAEGHYGIKADLTDPSAIPAIFDKVKQALGVPNTVIYNPGGLTPPPDQSNIFSVPIEKLQSDINLLSTTPFAAAREAVAGFATLPASTKKTFILTGNLLNRVTMPIPTFVTLGIGKSAAASWVGLAAATFADRGYRFYYGSERSATGGAVLGGPNGPGTAEVYLKLATDAETLPWDYTFVTGKGFVDFGSK